MITSDKVPTPKVKTKTPPPETLSDGNSDAQADKTVNRNPFRPKNKPKKAEATPTTLEGIIRKKCEDALNADEPRFGLHIFANEILAEIEAYVDLTKIDV